jgi:dipeptidyl aminopeptidase/acylaminoacyl peptidase
MHRFRMTKLLPFSLIAAVLLGALLLIGCQSMQEGETTPTSTPLNTISPVYSQATPQVTATLIPITVSALQSYLPSGANGNIEALQVITDTGRTIYYELTYWSDGLRVKGIFGYPKGAGPYPAVIFNRGGNRDYGALCGWELIPFVESGYVTVGSQYRGNVGGEGVEEFGGADVNDVLNLVLLLKSLPIVDPERIGMVGMSRGGMETYVALKQDPDDGIQDIKVAAVVSGVADMFMWSEELQGILEDVMIPLIGASPQDRPDLYEARSATYWPELINVPLLIQHGEADDRISVAEARKLAQGLQEAGKTVELVVYPGEDHALSQHKKGFPEILSWFQRYLELPGEDLSVDTHRDDINLVAAWFQEHHSTP